MLLSIQGEAALVAGHVLRYAVGSVSDVVTSSEHLTQVGVLYSRVVKVGDEVTVVVIKTQLATLLQGGDIRHCVYQVITDIVTTHTLSGAGHGGVTNMDKMSIRDKEDEEYEEYEEYTSASHSDDDDKKKLSNKQQTYTRRDKRTSKPADKKGVHNCYVLAMLWVQSKSPVLAT